MKLMFASDLHGSLYWAKALKAAWEREKPGKLILLGDLLYHGPRNDLPRDYDPKGVTALLSEMKEELLCVRGNCEAEVDQMVLPFPVMADYMVLWLGDRMAFVTHGHLYNEDRLPMLKRGDLLIHGHTHVPVIRPHKEEGYVCLNPGSVSLPKEDTPHSYMVFEDGRFSIRSLEDGKEFLGGTADV